jgi:hypothetical protein
VAVEDEGNVGVEDTVEDDDTVEAEDGDASNW